MTVYAQHYLYGRLVQCEQKMVGQGKIGCYTQRLKAAWLFLDWPVRSTQ